MQTRKQLVIERTDMVPFAIWIVVVYITWTFMRGADHFLEFTPEALGKYYDYRWILIAHITAGGGTLIFGLVQFWEKLRKYSPRLHRIVGLLYVIAILVSSFCALVLAFTTAYHVNLPYAFSLQVWASVWISSTFIAYYAALRKRFRLHKEWMMRSYIVTIAFVISGLLSKTAFVQSLGSFDEISPSLIWMGWTVPLYVYELVRSGKQEARLSSRPAP